MTVALSVPFGWHASTLGDVFVWASGGTPTSDNPEYYGGPIPWVVIGDLNDGRVTATSTSITEKGLANSAAKWVSPGSVLVAMYGSIGKAGIAGTRLTTNQAIAFTNPEPVEARYLFWYVKHSQNALMGLGKGATQRNINQELLKAFPFPLAPLIEQSRICEKLEELLSDLDAAVAALERARGNLKRYRAAVLKAALEGKLTAEWRKANPPSEPADKLLERILVERREKWEETQLTKYAAQCKQPPKGWKDKYRQPQSASPGDDRAAYPNGWSSAGLAQVCVFQNGRAFPSDQYCASGFKLLRPGNLFADGSVRWDDKNTRALPAEWARRFPDYIVGGNEIVMNLTAQSLKDEFLGRVCMTSERDQCLLNQRLARIAPLSGVEPRFLLIVLKSDRFRSFVNALNTGSLIQHMFTSQLEHFVLPLPPLNEQEEIARVLEERFALLERIRSIVEKRIAQAATLRQAILKRAFEGKLVPQDPDDEPASVLLERIRAMRTVDATAASRAAAQRRGREIAGKAGPRMLSKAERDFLRRDKAESLGILRARRKTT